MKTLEVPKLNKIHLIGVELEGGWDECPDNFHEDGSVDCAGDTTGESVSDALTLTPLLKWIPRQYPDYTNESCGFHVHTSYRDNRDYETLMERKFYDFFLARITRWGKGYPIRNSAFWARLEGKNSFCRKNFQPLNQAFVTDKSGPRYAQLNYCWGLHGTLECRLFPMFKSSKTAQAAVCELISLIETYLLMNRPKPFKSQSILKPINTTNASVLPANKLLVDGSFPKKDKLLMFFDTAPPVPLPDNVPF